jgi:hypothetical protein
VTGGQPARCSHEYTEVAEEEATGDDVCVCCRCDEIVAPVTSGIPSRWSDHQALSEGHRPHVPRLAADVIEGDYPRTPNDGRIVHACGACGHLFKAVYSGYFDQDAVGEPPHEGDEAGSFLQGLTETVCPECGTVCYRSTSVVMEYEELLAFKKNADLQRWILNRADTRFWHGERGQQGIPATVDGPILNKIDEYAHRCPACGYAVEYGGREFDFHHWDYQNDIGCRLCRKCHDLTHGGQTASQQRDNSGTAWQRDAVKRLHELVSPHLEFSHPHEFIARFNIPRSNPAETQAKALIGDAVPPGEFLDEEGGDGQ